MAKYSELSSVAWVGSPWIAFVMVTVLAITTLSNFQSSDRVGYPILFFMFVLFLLLSYPYIHYRVKGGRVQRLPPRYVQDKKFLSKDYL